MADKKYSTLVCKFKKSDFEQNSTSFKGVECLHYRTKDDDDPEVIYISAIEFDHDISGLKWTG